MMNDQELTACYARYNKAVKGGYLRTALIENMALCRDALKKYHTSSGQKKDEHLQQLGYLLEIGKGLKQKLEGRLINPQLNNPEENA